MAGTRALSAHARQTAGGAHEQGFGVETRLAPGGSARTAPQLEKGRFPFLHSHVPFVFVAGDDDTRKRADKKTGFAFHVLVCLQIDRVIGACSPVKGCSEFSPT